MGLILGFLRGVPLLVWVVVAAVAWGGVQHLRASSKAAQLAQQRERAEQAEAANKRAFRVQEITDAATLQSQNRTVAVHRAATAGDGLRIAAQALAASAPTGNCKAAEDRIAVLANVLGLVESAGREMARIADERGDAGTACQRIAEVTP